MKYVQFHAQGLCTSTGVVEAGCKVAIGERLKQSGMHWRVRGADAIIALRCAWLSGRFEDFWERAFFIFLSCTPENWVLAFPSTTRH